jgi:predicted outer membrane protein
MLLAAAATASVGPAFAQTNPTNPPMTPSTSAAPPLSEAAKTHAEKTAQIGHASLQMANIALEKARRPKVREFAQFEHDEQTTVGAILKSMDPSLNPPNPPADIARAIDKLKQMRPGEAFDREFVAAQIQGHTMLRSIQEDYLKVAKDPDGVNTTKLVHGMIMEHLTLLSDLKKTRDAVL